MISQYFPENQILANPTHLETAQFLLDCSSLNLKNGLRLSSAHPAFQTIAKQCSNVVYAIHADRLRQLKTMGILSKWPDSRNVMISLIDTLV